MTYTLAQATPGAMSKKEAAAAIEQNKIGRVGP